MSLALLRALLSALALVAFGAEALSGALSPTLAAIAALPLLLSALAPHRRWALAGGVVVLALCFQNDEALMRHHRYLLGCALLWLGLAHDDDGARTLLKLQFSAVYVYAVVDKLDVEWLTGQRILWVLAEVWPRAFWLLWPAAPLACAVLAWGVVVVETAIAVVPWWRPRWGLLLVLAFHGAIQALLPVGVFGLVMVALVLAFRPQRAQGGGPVS